jgi:hypothetical protein
MSLDIISASAKDIDTLSAPSSPSPISTLPDELMLAILVMLPVQDRANLRTVSRRWQDLISDLGYHLEPLYLGYGEILYYTDDIWTQLHPCLNWGRNRDQSKPSIARGAPPFVKVVAMVDQDELLRKRSEFATRPPISVLELRGCELQGPIRERRTRHAVLRTVTPSSKRPEGIRIGDLVDSYAKMKAHDPTGTQEWDCSAYFATDKLHYGLETICEPASCGRFEVRRSADEDEDE